MIEPNGHVWSVHIYGPWYLEYGLQELYRDYQLDLGYLLLQFGY